jgi:hypothetical protein
MVRNIDGSNDPFGHNTWVDLALRLAYPGTNVGGIYIPDNNRGAPGMNIDIANGESRVLSEGPPTFAAPSHVLVFDYDAKSGEAKPVGSRPIKVENQQIPASRYNFCTTISGSKPDTVAIHRYGPITATCRTVCLAGGHN